MLNQLQDDPTHIQVLEITDDEEPDHSSDNAPVIYWSPTNGLCLDGTILSPATNLNHEAAHQLQRIQHPQQYAKDRNTPDAQYSNKEEKRVIEGQEQKTALALGEIKKGQVTRKDLKGENVTTTGPTSNKIDKTHEKDAIKNIKKILEDKRKEQKNL